MTWLIIIITTMKARSPCARSAAVSTWLISYTHQLSSPWAFVVCARPFCAAEITVLVVVVQVGRCRVYICVWHKLECRVTCHGLHPNQRTVSQHAICICNHSILLNKPAAALDRTMLVEAGELSYQHNNRFNDSLRGDTIVVKKGIILQVMFFLF